MFDSILKWFMPTMLSFGGGSGGGSSTTVKEMPEWAKPYAEDLLKTGMDAINQPEQTYGGMKVAPQNADQEMALSMARGRALSGSPDEIAARAMNTATQSGSYLGANPWLNQDYTQKAIEANAQSMGRAYAGGTAAQLDSAAAHARAFGGTGYQQQVGQNEANLGNAIGSMANQYQLGRTGMGVEDWQKERANMVSGNAGALAGAKTDWENINHLYSTGNEENKYTQSLLDQAYKDFLEQQNLPYKKIDQAGSLLNTAVGNTGQGTVSSTGGGNQNMDAIMRALGLGIAGYSAYKL